MIEHCIADVKIESIKFLITEIVSLCNNIRFNQQSLIKEIRLKAVKILLRLLNEIEDIITRKTE